MSVDTDQHPQPATPTQILPRLRVACPEADQVAGAAEATWRAYQQALAVFDHQPPIGAGLAAMLHYAATRADLAWTDLRSRVDALLGASFIYACAVSLIFLLGPWGYPPLPVQATFAGCVLLAAAAWMAYRRAEKRQRRDVPTWPLPSDGELHPRGSAGRIGQEMDLIADNICTARHVIAAVLAQLPDPHDAPPPRRRTRRHRSAARRLRTADALLTLASGSLTYYRHDLGVPPRKRCPARPGCICE
jgi:hypothetical protein